MRTKAIGLVAVGVALSLGFGNGRVESQSPKPLDRTVLPIPEPDYPHSTVLDARDTTPPPRFEVKAPAGAPNVLIVLVDDMGFGMPSSFGGPVRMPTSEALAKQGLRYNQFHTTALCSPTRTALLSGRNHHMNNMGGITEIATAFPGNTGARPANVAPLAEMLRLNGYSTGFFGKNHETAAWEVSPSGPTDRWPTRSGFDKFYGFMGGETDQWNPSIYDGLTRVPTPHTPGYNFMTDMTDQAIAWMKFEKALTPDKPFFMYFAPGATHAPHHVPKEWIDKNKGRFDAGWDKMREATLARQIEMGVVPKGTKLAAKPKDIKDWDTLSADEKKLFARQMEVYSGFGEYTDHEIGRLFDAIGDTGQLDNTLIFYIIGDNGTSAEGGMFGMFNEMTYFNGVAETVQEMLKHYDEWGGPGTYPHMAAGWAVAGDTPFMWTKQIPSNYGGTRNGVIVSWPKRIKAANQIRSQWHHVIDVAPTVLEAASLPEPKSVNGVVQAPIEGVSMVYSFDKADAREHPQDPVLRDHGQSRHLQRRLVRRHHPPCTLGAEAPPQAAGRHLGAVRHAQRLQPGQRPGRLESGEAQGAAGPLHEGGDHLPRAAHRRPASGAPQRGLGGPARPDGRPHVAHPLRGHGGDERERVHQHQEPVVLDQRGRRHSAGRRERSDPGPGRPVRRLEPVPEGRQADVSATTSSGCSSTRSRHRRRWPRARPPFA